MPRSSLVPALVNVLLAVACGGGVSRPPVASISLTASGTGPLTSLGDTLLVTAIPLDAQGKPIAGVAIAFTTSNAAVATVTQGGLVAAAANGTATIHASAETKEATLEVAVAQVVAQVVVTPSSIRVPPSETPLFRTAVMDARGNLVASAPGAVWTTTDSTVAIIGSDGRATVSSAAPQGATVRAVATVGAISSTTGGSMTVDPAAVYVETIVLAASGSTSFASLNQTLRLSAMAANPRQGDVTASVSFNWTSSSPAVAGVSSTGLVTALGNGSAKIDATSNGVSGALAVTVAQVVATVSVATAGGTPAPSLASLGDTLPLVAAAKDAGGSAIAGASFTWQSDTPLVASVDAGGLVTAVGNGTAHVLAKATTSQLSNPTPGFVISVQQVVASLSVTPASTTIPRCTTVKFAAAPKDARGNPVTSAPAPTWRSASTAVATVDGNGLARAVATGGPIGITATTAGVSGTAQLAVDSSPIRLSWGMAQATLDVTICSGQSVIWHNVDGNVVHTASSFTGAAPNTGDIQPGTDSVPQLFSTSGSYTYHCLYHQHSGTVTVTP